MVITRGRRRSHLVLLQLLLLLLVIVCHASSSSYDDDHDIDDESRFMLRRFSKPFMKTEAGEMRVLESYGGRFTDKPLHIGFITMEPKSLFIPQYFDSTLIIFIRRGVAKLGFIYKDELAERILKTGDVYRIPAGSVFYLLNTEQGQRLHVISCIDPSESLGFPPFQSFYIGGGTFPPNVLSGFDSEILENAFNASRAEIDRILSRKLEGPIVYVGDSHAPSIWTKFLQLKEELRLESLKKMAGDRGEAVNDEEGEEEDEEEEKRSVFRSWRKLLKSVFGYENKGEKRTAKSPDSYNLYDKKPNFKNRYGWSVALDGYDYAPLRKSGVGVYLVNLTAGSMMAPHMNPRATEYGVVLSGSGRIQVVFPNGTAAMNAEIKEGDVFFVPRYFPFCQIASRSGWLEFFGFTTSARKNRPQFLAGKASLFHTLMGPELAAAFGVTEDAARRVAYAQRESIILPSPRAAPGHVDERRRGDYVADGIAV